MSTTDDNQKKKKNPSPCWLCIWHETIPNTMSRMFKPVFQIEKVEPTEYATI